MSMERVQRLSPLNSREVLLAFLPCQGAQSSLRFLNLKIDTSSLSRT